MSLTSTAAAAAATPLSTNIRKTKNNISIPRVSALSSPSAPSSHDNVDQATKYSSNIIHSINIPRRCLTLGLMGAVLGLSADNGSAMAAARRPPPPPPTEKQDPNISGALAKALASKRRKEEMKEAIAKLREKGKPVS